MNYRHVSKMIGRAHRVLRRAGVSLQPGLSDTELKSVEHRFGFAFNDDHRAFLAAALPVGNGWIDWRREDHAAIEDRLNWPVSGVLFDVEANGYWPRAWGEKPSNLDAALNVARRRLAEVPRLIPIYSHRYLPAGPLRGISPVLSVHQTDVIYYGHDLLDYVAHEFGRGRREADAGTPLRVPFWTDLIYDQETDFWVAH